jgi:hypothetical protein
MLFSVFSFLVQCWALAYCIALCINAFLVVHKWCCQITSIFKAEKEYEYDGDMIDEKCTVSGSCTRPNGDWLPDERFGKATLTLPSGETFEGDFVHTMRTGKGTYNWPDGNEYDGDFVQDVRTDRGIPRSWPDGCRYIGRFVSSKPPEKRTFVCTSGKLYDGIFVDQKRNSQLSDRRHVRRKIVGSATEFSNMPMEDMKSVRTNPES